MKKNKRFFILLVFALITFVRPSYGSPSVVDTQGIRSIDTGYTILNIRTATTDGQSYIVANSYEGIVLGISYDGTILWKNPLSGYMNHDIWCGDLTGDGTDEIVTANADGNIYCLDHEGKLRWKFNRDTAPMYTVCVAKQKGKSYIVAGGMDKSIYYISPEGKLIKEIKSSTFSIETPWALDKSTLPEKNRCTANFIRMMKRSDGTQSVVLLGTNNHMQAPGTLYFFNILADTPYRTVKLQAPDSLRKQMRIRPIGDFRTADINHDGNEEIILGASANVHDLLVTTYDDANKSFTYKKITHIPFGYDIAHTTTITQDGHTDFLTRAGSQFILYNPKDNTKEERLIGHYAYNDMWQDPATHKILLASAQSGGSCIHIIDPKNKHWKSSLEHLTPIGNIASILRTTKEVRDALHHYRKPSYQRPSQPVYLMTESVPRHLESLKDQLSAQYHNPIFLHSLYFKEVENWDRSAMSNEKYRKGRDRRRRYTLSSQEALSKIIRGYDGAPGLAYWGGHGNDPYMFSKQTTETVLSQGKGKKTVLIYPEMEDHSDNLNFMVNDLLYPLARYAQGKNANIYLRSKHVFWLGSNYTKPWSRLITGEFADVFVPSMEETTDKSMDLSLSGRLGMWTSGAVNSWGTRAVPDNTAFDRSRQLGAQRLPNHFLRMLIYHTAYGAQYINNFPVDQDYMSLYWELIAKGALYVPKRSEVLSFSPVHLSMESPDPHFLKDGNNVKWTVFYDQTFEKNNPFVFSRLNGTWPGAPVTPWDFSRYASGVKDRRLHFLAPNAHGLVLITPPQGGIYADAEAPRGLLVDHLHPIYKKIMKEYITDGRNYYSADGKETYAADKYYRTIQSAITSSANQLPITVSGDVAWVVSQVSPKHLRLTLIDSGYINPHERTATITFHTIQATHIQDILNKETFQAPEDTLKIKIPAGGFRFIDIEMSKTL